MVRLRQWMGAFVVCIGDGCCIVGSEVEMAQLEDMKLRCPEERMFNSMGPSVPFAIRVGGGAHGWKDLHAALASTGQRAPLSPRDFSQDISLNANSVWPSHGIEGCRLERTCVLSVGRCTQGQDADEELQGVGILQGSVIQVDAVHFDAETIVSPTRWDYHLHEIK